ncbi:MAG: hypothetical protein N2Z21_00185 [Candidatus Sumerlaeaceae bacterium]|nr:hypothetical protein [Candidatus Sumerlaeaceae bacterium]
MELVEFAVGDKVEHLAFGKGTVTAVYGSGELTKVVVNFGKEIGEKKLLVKVAKLRKIADRTKLEAVEEPTGGGDK